MTKDGKKLSKSLGNSIYVKDIIEKYSPEALKLFLNKGQYNQSQEYKEDELKEAHVRWENFVSEIPSYIAQDSSSVSLLDDVIVALEDDFNTPLAVSVLYSALKELKATKSQALAKDVLKVLKLLSVVKTNDTLDSIFEKWHSAQQDKVVPQEVLDLVEQRAEAKKNKDFDLADKLRTQVNALGWNVKDVAGGYEVEEIL